MTRGIAEPPFVRGEVVETIWDPTYPGHRGNVRRRWIVRSTHIANDCQSGLMVLVRLEGRSRGGSKLDAAWFAGDLGSRS